MAVAPFGVFRLPEVPQGPRDRRAEPGRAGALPQLWRAPTGLAVLLALLQAAGVRHALEYRRTAVLRGQVWRLVTGNLVHLGWVHLARDVAGLFLIWALVAQSLGRRSRVWVMAVCGLAVGLGLLVFNPQIEWYVGISGVLFGLLCAGVLSQLRERPLFAGALLVGMTAVIGWTLYAGALPGETRGLGGRVVPQAHLYGALGGAAFILVRAALRAYCAHQRGSVLRAKS